MTVSILDENYLAIAIIITVGYQLIFFIITYIVKFDKITDFGGSTNFILIALTTFFLHQTYYTRQIIVTCLVCIWAIRLGLFLLIRILKWGEDNRFDNIRTNFFKLLGFYAFQILWVWVVSLPVTFINSSNKNPNIDGFDIAGICLWAIGVCIEAIADVQKLVYKQDPTNHNHWCDKGLWKYSRHPNYFGEMMVWWGVFLLAVPILFEAKWVAILSPLFLMFLLLFLSGIPPLEKSMEQRFGQREDFRLYKTQTSPLIVMPRIVYKNIPHIIKVIFLFEFPFYNKSSDNSTPLTESNNNEHQKEEINNYGSA
ncbi:unnamed protein product [Didymodactylos carnosus]|uniref:Steroid 5-alpha reductase C-terminal domain-containing protein n=1 Tax=Didymodactylos carnosus TaxID=1234261 RepID=A0A813X6J3_9BILA|nr:unnamed protein product [Didymodactylos carnosus]CAF1263207.1 unnamed protein product [Didymodactylos carnosus]CAF3654675.1 unnamed protein product [Didymodactylos carnosus]CAF4069636.1 unnamed protein product [Didymodactylos carnosus]